MIQEQLSTSVRRINHQAKLKPNHTHAVHQLSQLLITGTKEEKVISEYWQVTNQCKNLKVILSNGKQSLSILPKRN